MRKEGALERVVEGTARRREGAGLAGPGVAGWDWEKGQRAASVRSWQASGFIVGEGGGCRS